MTVIWTQSPEELAQEKAQRRLDQLNGIPERDGPAAAEIGGGGRFGLRFARRSQDRALDRELEARKIDVLERQGDARLMNERSVAMTEALSGLRGGFGRPAVSSNLGGMSRITPQAPRASIAASIDEDLDPTVSGNSMSLMANKKDGFSMQPIIKNPLSDIEMRVSEVRKTSTTTKTQLFV